MENCLVTRLKGVVNNPNLKTLFTGYRDKADFAIVPQYVQVVGTNLAVESFMTGECRIEVTFVGINNNTTGILFAGYLHEGDTDKVRAQFRKNYVVDSSGLSTYKVVSAYGSGIVNGGEITLSKDTEYKAVLQQGTCKIYNATGDLVDTIIYTESGNQRIDKLFYGVLIENDCRKDMFYLNNLKIIKTQDESVLLDVYPAVDNNNQGCLYDNVNECFYHANTGQLAVSND